MQNKPTVLLFSSRRSHSAQTYSPFWTVTIVAILAMLILGVAGIYDNHRQLQELAARAQLHQTQIEQAMAFAPVRADLSRQQTQITQLEAQIGMRTGTVTIPPSVQQLNDALSAQAATLELASTQQTIETMGRIHRVTLGFGGEWFNFAALMDWVREQGWCPWIAFVTVEQGLTGRHYELILEIPAS